jgi:tetratricopeptide (TPR) repeat protein
MRSFLPVIFGSLLLASALYSQAATRAHVQNGVENAHTRELGSLSQGNQQTDKQGSAAIPWRSLSSEEGDDPTIPATAIPKHAPQRTARKAAEKAERLSKKGCHEDAIAEFRSALDIDARYYEAENNLALELEAAGKAEDAEKTLRHLIQSAPEHVLGFTNLGALLCEQHRYVEAEAVARQALERHQFSFKANFLLGTVLVDQGKRTDEAKLKLQYAQVKYAQAKALLDRWPAPDMVN